MNLSEAITKMVSYGGQLEDVVRHLDQLSLSVLSFDANLARIAASFYPATHTAGISLGDRCCLAAALRYRLPVLTADHAWKTLSLDVKIEFIR